VDDAIRIQIESLRSLKTTELRARYCDLFGEASPSWNRAHLFRRIAWRLQAQAEGDLSERASVLRSWPTTLMCDCEHLTASGARSSAMGKFQSAIRDCRPMVQSSSARIKGRSSESRFCRKHWILMFLKVRLHVANRPFSDRSHRLRVAWRARLRVWLRSRPSIRRAIPSAMNDGAREHTSSQLEYFGGG